MSSRYLPREKRGSSELLSLVRDWGSAHWQWRPKPSCAVGEGQAGPPQGPSPLPSRPCCARLFLDPRALTYLFLLFPSPSPHLSAVSRSTLSAHPRSFTYKEERGNLPFPAYPTGLASFCFKCPRKSGLNWSHSTGRGGAAQSRPSALRAQHTALLFSHARGQDLTGVLRA